jgi:iron complex transport system substrate-binding protein
MIPKLLIVSILTICLLTLCACQSGSPATSATAAGTAVKNTAMVTGPLTSNSASAITTNSNISTAKFPMTFKDDAGRQITLKSQPHNLVSLSPSNTEIVYALGLGNQLVGNTKYCNYPEAAKNVTKVGGFSDVDIEKVLAAQPDLILASNIHEEKVLPSLEKLGMTVIIVHPITLDDIYRDISLIGQITGQSREASDLLEGLTKRVEAIKNRTSQLSGAKPRVMYVTWHDPLYSAGDNTITGELIKIAGGDNIAKDINGYAAMTLESVVQRNPQIIVVMSSMGSKTSTDYIKTESRLQSTDALKNNLVFTVDSDLFGRTTPRIVDALEQLANVIQPGRNK